MFTLNERQHRRSPSNPSWCHDPGHGHRHNTHKHTLHRPHAQIFEQTMLALFTSASFRLMMSTPHCCPLLTSSESKSSMRITVLTECWRPDTQSNSSRAFSGTSHTTVAIQAAQHTHTQVINDKSLHSWIWHVYPYKSQSLLNYRIKESTIVFSLYKNSNSLQLFSFIIFPQISMKVRLTYPCRWCNLWPPCPACRREERRSESRCNTPVLKSSTVERFLMLPSKHLLFRKIL